MTRIIDIQQVLMQEPRVAFKEAELIVHPEMQKEIIRQRRVRENRRLQTLVEKSERLSPKVGIRSRIANARSGRNLAQPGHVDISV